MSEAARVHRDRAAAVSAVPVKQGEQEARELANPLAHDSQPGVLVRQASRPRDLSFQVSNLMLEPAPLKQNCCVWHLFPARRHSCGFGSLDWVLASHLWWRREIAEDDIPCGALERYVAYLKATQGARRSAPYLGS